MALRPDGANPWIRGVFPRGVHRPTQRVLLQLARDNGWTGSDDDDGYVYHLCLEMLDMGVGHPAYASLYVRMKNWNLASEQAWREPSDVWGKRLGITNPIHDKENILSAYLLNEGNKIMTRKLATRSTSTEDMSSINTLVGTNRLLSTMLAHAHGVNTSRIIPFNTPINQFPSNPALHPPTYSMGKPYKMSIEPSVASSSTDSEPGKTDADEPITNQAFAEIQRKRKSREPSWAHSRSAGSKRRARQPSPSSGQGKPWLIGSIEEGGLEDDAQETQDAETEGHEE